MTQQALLGGQVALVTGAGRGIGRAIAVVLGGAGASLILLARTGAELEETQMRVHDLGGEASSVPTDVSRYEDVQRAVAQGLEQFGRIDILVNNAGIQSPIGPLVENDPVEWTNTIAVNLLGTFYCTQAVLPGMIARRRGKIINLSGGGAAGPRPNFSAYAASKAAIVRLTETLAEEVRPYDIQVNAIAPGAVNTRMLDEVLAAGAAAGAEWTTAQERQRQGGTPVEWAAELVLFLASDASGGLTGKLISVLHDDWRTWDVARIAKLMASPWHTLRRIDPYTLHPLIGELR